MPPKRPDKLIAPRTSEMQEAETSGRTGEASTCLLSSEGAASGEEEIQPFSSRLWVDPDGRALGPASNSIL